jgi:hypothetical protein
VGEKMIKRCMRYSLILLMTGTFVSATQASMAGPAGARDDNLAGTCFTEKAMLDLSSLTVEPSYLLVASGSLSLGAAADTLEVHEIELEDEGKEGTNYKAIVGFTIAAIFIGYALYILIVPDDDEEAPEQPPGKEPPAALITIPFGG